MARTRKSVTITLKVTAPAKMKIAHIRREVITRINHLTGHYCSADLGLGWREDGPDGNIRIKAALHKE